MNIVRCAKLAILIESICCKILIFPVLIPKWCQRHISKNVIFWLRKLTFHFLTLGWHFATICKLQHYMIFVECLLSLSEMHLFLCHVQWNNYDVRAFMSIFLAKHLFGINVWFVSCWFCIFLYFVLFCR